MHGQILHIRVMLICNMCFILSSFWLVLSEVPEQAHAQRTCSPALVGTCNFKMLWQEWALASCLCYRDAPLTPVEQPVNGCWMKLALWLWVAAGVAPGVKWAKKTCWVEHSRQKPCQSWVSLKMQVMQGNTYMEPTLSLQAKWKLWVAGSMGSQGISAIWGFIWNGTIQLEQSCGQCEFNLCFWTRILIRRQKNQEGL